ncbi:MAG TPA: hypothetical protein VHK69_06680 [Chitinophagaceae bacterium]|jgi:hypothetical protein|nr:hypothetical protein [Chitinophagaceae bacterium]
MREEEPIDHRQGLQLIEQMISAARNEHQEKGDGWLIWGWLLFVASVASALLIYGDQVRAVGWVWTAILPLGAVVALVFQFRKSGSEAGVKSYAGALLDKLGKGFFISLFLLVAAGIITESHYAFGYYYILYGFWMYIHASALNFRPLLVGAFVNWAAALAIFFIARQAPERLTVPHAFGYEMVVSAAAILIGYLVPGYLLRQQYHKKTRGLSNRV